MPGKSDSPAPSPRAPVDADATAQLRGVPLSDLISAPLSAASDAQRMLARSTVEFIDTIGLNPKEGSAPRTAQLIQFSLSRPQTLANGEIREEKIELGVPLLSLVAPPNLQVKKVSVDFDMRIKSSVEVREDSSRERTTDVTKEGGAGAAGQPDQPRRLQFHGEVASQREQTRKTDNSARLRIHIEAEQAPPPEGLSRVLDILATACAPRKIERK